jgi:cyanophycinase-like exopeptidase
LVEKLSPGRIVIFGSGETSAAGGRVLTMLARDLPVPLRVAILETPAGFEPNSAQVAKRIAEFMRVRLQNYQPQIALVPARKKETPFSPDNPAIIQPLWNAAVIFLGPGSPTYATRQLHDSLAWYTLLARHRLGADIVMASAAALAASAQTLPVYEIYKVGAELHWCAGLNLFGAFGLELVFVPHWNNKEGGVELDTSRCFMGEERFRRLYAQLSPTVTVVGIDEHTALIFDFTTSTCAVSGLGGVTVWRAGQEQRFRPRDKFLFQALGAYQIPDIQMGIPAAIWEQVRKSAAQPSIDVPPPAEVITLAYQRQAARQCCNWALADQLRDHIEGRGWQISDTADGLVLEPMRTKV